MSKRTVLVDIALGYKNCGFSGIPQDSRLLFNGLGQSEKFDSQGLIWSTGSPWLGKPLTCLEEQAVFLGPHLMGVGSRKANLFERALFKLSPQLGQLYHRALQRKSHYELFKLNESIEVEQIWRNFFNMTLPVSAFQTVKNKQYFLTDLSYSRVADGIHKRLPLTSINTQGQDFVIFQDSRAVKVSDNTTKIIRYHDGLPVFSSDTMGNEWQTREHIRAVKLCEHDSVYVCNSDSALNDLSKISPIAAKNARVIPYFLPKMERVNSDVSVLKQIASTKISSSTLKPGNESKVLSKWFEITKDVTSNLKYIMSLATIEPRKNYQGLINAWQKLRFDTGEDIKLMIVGSPGWEFEQTLASMRPFVESGDLLHLEKVAQIEMPYLYSAATCFVFPSYGEGFGLPPSEAMQCGCPVIMSDIPAHRYSAGDGALFFNPYDIDDMTAKIKSIVQAPKQSSFVSNLVTKGYRNVDRYSIEEVLPQWEALFEELSLVNK